MMVKEHIDRIKHVYPGLGIDKAEQNSFGQNNDVIIINEDLVFRFPKYAKGIIDLEKEVALLKLLNKKITLPIPSPEYLSLDDSVVGKTFAGYSLLSGSSMWSNDLKKVKQPQLKKLATQIVNFLIELHTFPPKKVKSILHQKDISILKETKALYLKLQNMVFPFMRLEARETVAFQFESFIINEEIRNTKPVLIHGDFGASNILWLADRCEISGIIDFGASGLGDPAYDFAGILSSYGEDFFNLCINHYPDGREIYERVKFHKSTFALQEALHGLENNDEQAFKNGISTYL